MITEKEVIKAVADKLGIKRSVVKEVFRFQFKMLKETMKKGEFEVYTLKYFGKFMPNGKVDHYIKTLPEDKLGETLTKYAKRKRNKQLAEETGSDLFRLEE